MSRPKFTAALGVVALVGVVSAPVDAALVLNVREGGGPVIPILDNGPLDVNPAAGAIAANAPALNALLINFAFTDLGADSNSLLGVPLTNTPATLGQSGSVFRTTFAAPATIEITAADNGYLFPSGNPKDMHTAASDVFRFTTPGDSRTFQSTFDAGAPIPSPLLAFIPPVGPGPFGTSNPGVTTLLGVQPTPFALSNTTVITLGSGVGGPATPERDQFSGATVVTAIPEPAAASALGFAIATAVASGRRRRN